MRLSAAVSQASHCQPLDDAGMRAEALFPGGHVEAVVGESYRLKSDPAFASDSAPQALKEACSEFGPDNAGV